MILGTDRLTLRPLQSTDVEAVASYSTKPEFIRFLPLPPQTMESAAQFVEQALPTVNQIPREPSQASENRLPNAAESAPPPSRSVDQFIAILWSASIAAGEARCSEGISRSVMD